jgi:hypothetical protein
MPITHRPKIETGSQPTAPFEVIPRIYLSYITSDTSSKASDSTIANTPVARLPKNSSSQRIRHSKPESWSTSVIGIYQQLPSTSFGGTRGWDRGGQMRSMVRLWSPRVT